MKKNIILLVVFLAVVSSACKKNLIIKLPKVETVSVNLSSENTPSIMAAGMVFDNGLVITETGICVSKKTEPTVNDSKKTVDVKLEIPYEVTVNGLENNTTYYVRAYAVSEAGVGYGKSLPIKINTSVPTISTNSLSTIAPTLIISGGNVTNNGGLAIIEQGICWSIVSNPTTTSSKVVDRAGTNWFNCEVTGLTPGKKYYFRAYATNGVGTAYGNENSATTPATQSVVSTSTVSIITTTSAISGGNITNDGGASIIARGVCWSTISNPTITGSKTNDGAGAGLFSSSIIGLIPGTTYYIRAYVTNSAGTTYGNETTFKTASEKPIIITAEPLLATTTSARSGGNVTYDGGSSIYSYGVCWSTVSGPTIANSKTMDGTGTGVFVSFISGLTPGKIYYARAYATNIIGTSYGNETTFRTLALAATVSTTPISDFSTTSAKSGGNISDDGGANITARGVCWSLSHDPTTSDSKTNDGMGAGLFGSSITGLTPGKTYYVRAYATNITGTSYGNEQSFVL